MEVFFRGGDEKRKALQEGTAATRIRSGKAFLFCCSLILHLRDSPDMTFVIGEWSIEEFVHDF